MLKFTTLALCVFVSGCICGPPWGVVNNTAYRLTVVQDGRNIAELAPGQAITVPPVWMQVSHVSVMAHVGTNYLGANSYTFGDAPYNWQVDHVFVPGGRR